jgi:uncharacterized protein YndB with AHSA1/START domain
MASAASGPETSLQVRRTFAAPRERVFAAWTERQHLESSMCKPDPRSVARYLEFDLREGGKHLLEVRSPNGHQYLNKAAINWSGLLKSSFLRQHGGTSTRKARR